MFELINKVLSEQAPSGAFYTTVLHQGHRFRDENGLVTCLVLGELSRLPPNETVSKAIEKGLGFVQQCVATTQQSFHLHPTGSEPKWLRGNTPRTDDTALCAMTLAKHGLISDVELEMVLEEMDACRLLVQPKSSFPWVHQGAYKTWLDPKRCPNRVDCVVNAHVATFLKFLGREDHPGYQSAVGTVCDGVRMVAQTPNSTGLLCPYHPDAKELIMAIERAIDQGVSEFEAILPEARKSLKPMRRNAGLSPVGGSGDRQTLWFSHGLQVARNLVKYHGEPAPV